MRSTKRKSNKTEASNAEADAEPAKTKVKVPAMDRLMAEMQKLENRLEEQRNKVKAEATRLFKKEFTDQLQTTRATRAIMERGFKHLDVKQCKIATRTEYDTGAKPAFTLCFGEDETFTSDQVIAELVTILVAGSKVKDPTIIDPDNEDLINSFCQFLLHRFLKGLHAKLSAVFDDLIAVDELLDQNFGEDMEESE